MKKICYRNNLKRKYLLGLDLFNEKIFCRNYFMKKISYRNNLKRKYFVGII